MEYPFIAGIALALYDQHGSICPGKGAEVIEPVGKRAVTERECAFLVGRLALQLRRPEQEKDGLSMKEERVRAVIDILSAEVPEIQAHRFREALQCHSHFAKLDPVGGRDARVEWQIAQTATQLRLADPAVAEEQDLDLRVDPLAGLKVLVVGADFIQDVFERMLAADFRGRSSSLQPNRLEVFQRGQQGFEWGKPANAERSRPG